MGTLLFHGHDLHHLLDSYTMEQVQLMARAIWRHSLTLVSVGGFVLGGAGGGARADQVRGRKPGGPKGPDLTHLWQPYFDKGLRWNLREPPRITPEEDSRRKIAMLEGLLGPIGTARLLQPQRPPETAPAPAEETPGLDGGAVPTDADDGLEAFLEQLRRAEQIEREE